MESNQQRLIRYLQDAHASEVGIENALTGFLKDSNDPDVNQVLSEHRDVTRSQADRLEQRLIELGGSVSAGKGMMNSIMAALGDAMNSFHDQYDQITMDLVNAFATEHLEIGMYTALESFARSCGDEETARLAREIMDEEQEAADKIEPLIDRCASATVRST